MKFTEETVKAAAFTLSAFCSSQECGTCPFGGTDGNAEIPCLFKSAEPATWFPMALEMNEPAFMEKRQDRRTTSGSDSVEAVSDD